MGHRLQLNDLLIKPVQRIMKYQLLLKVKPTVYGHAHAHARMHRCLLCNRRLTHKIASMQECITSGQLSGQWVGMSVQAVSNSYRTVQR